MWECREYVKIIFPCSLRIPNICILKEVPWATHFLTLEDKHCKRLEVWLPLHVFLKLICSKTKLQAVKKALVDLAYGVECYSPP